jgi:hypothetical protein
LVWTALTTPVIAIALTGCSAHSNPVTHPNMSISAGSTTSRRAAALSLPLRSIQVSSSPPAGFSFGSQSSTAEASSQLSTAPVIKLRPADLSPAPLPPNTMIPSAQAMVDQVVKTRIRRLFVEGDFASHAKITVAGQFDKPTRPHDADIILVGPDYRADRLVSLTTSGLAAATITLPTMASGQWSIGIEDLSAVSTGPNGVPNGTDLLALGIFNVS